MKKYVKWVATLLAMVFMGYQGLSLGHQLWQNAFLFYMWFMGVISALSAFGDARKMNVTDAFPKQARHVGLFISLGFAMWLAAYGFFVTAVVYAVGRIFYAAKYDEAVTLQAQKTEA